MTTPATSTSHTVRVADDAALGPGLPAGFHDEPLAAPRSRSLLREVRMARELPRLLLGSPRLASAPRGNGDPVLLVPGIGSDDWATAPLRAYLRRLGHDARGWGLGRNHGDVEPLVTDVANVVASWHASAGRPVHLVGWSLGGVVAREVARAHPDRVAQVISYGTPVVGGPVYTVAARRYSRQTIAHILRIVEEANRTPIPVPLTSIYSRADGVVAWRASIDTLHPHTRHVEVRSTHTGLGLDPDVWLAVAHRLVEPGPRADAAEIPSETWA
jgi:pimeloyl-ACP methyl ester carboxylesterase